MPWASVSANRTLTGVEKAKPSTKRDARRWAPGLRGGALQRFLDEDLRAGLAYLLLGLVRDSRLQRDDVNLLGDVLMRCRCHRHRPFKGRKSSRSRVLRKGEIPGKRLL